MLPFVLFVVLSVTHPVELASFNTIDECNVPLTNMRAALGEARDHYKHFCLPRDQFDALVKNLHQEDLESAAEDNG